MIEAISKSECNDVKKVFVTNLGPCNMKDLPQTDIPYYMEAYMLDTVSYSTLSVFLYLLPITSITGHT